MKGKLWKNKWFILILTTALFFGATSTKVALANTDVQLDKILKSGLDGLIAYFDWLIDLLKLIW